MLCKGCGVEVDKRFKRGMCASCRHAAAATHGIDLAAKRARHAEAVRRYRSKDTTKAAMAETSRRYIERVKADPEALAKLRAQRAAATRRYRERQAAALEAMLR